MFGLIKRLTIAAVAIACVASAHAETPLTLPKGPTGLPTVVPPPLSLKRAAYFKAHLDEWQKVVAKLPKMKLGPSANVSSAEPTVMKPEAANSWTTLYHTAPESGLSNPLLLSNGNVIVHIACSTHWYKLTPAINGDYAYGNWTAIASLPSGANYAPLYFASQVLRDGNVIMNGGEYGGNNTSCDTDRGTGGALYNPNNNTWTTVAPPSGWSNIGDASSIIRLDNTYMLSNCCTTQQAFLSYPAMTWTAVNVSGKFDVNNEEGWAFTQDGRIVTTDAYVFTNTCGDHTEAFAANASGWSALPDASFQMSDCNGNSTGNGPSYEVGPIVLRTDGSLVAFSGVADGNPAGIAIFTPSTNTWAPGPHVPYINSQNYDLADAPATSTADGNIVFAASPGLFSAPAHFFAFTPDNQIVELPDAPNASTETSYVYNMLTLPTGQVLLTDTNSNAAYIYTPPTSTEVKAAIPVITSMPTTSITRNTNYRLVGKQFSGITQGSYGDDVQSATNFPVVRVTNIATHHVFYGTTSYFTSRSVTPNTPEAVNFIFPARTETGPSIFQVIGNGVRSVGVNVTIN